MSNYAYIAIDPRGDERHGTLEVADEQEAFRRIKEMGWFPTKVLAPAAPKQRRAAAHIRYSRRASRSFSLPWFNRVKSAHLAIFTRQVATLVEAGLPLLRGLRLLEQQEEHSVLKRIIGEVAQDIENGDTMADAVSKHPRVFNRLYVNMVRAGEIGGALETTLQRLADFMEKAQKIKNRVKAAMFYPCAVLVVAAVIVGILMTFVVPRFSAVFADLLGGRPLPAFTRFVFGLSAMIQQHVFVTLSVLAVLLVLFMLSLRTQKGRWAFDRFKLAAPVLGPLFRKLAVSRFARTLGTLISNGVPILQALQIVKETVGNVVVADLIGVVHDNVKQGDPIAPGLKASPIFPAMVGGMVEVGEQTGALPEMLMKVADTYDDQVDNAANALTSLLEPIMIVFLAVVVGSIVVAMFLPLVNMIMFFDPAPVGHAAE
jgi:type IV pilus assembly protein PilC